MSLKNIVVALMGVLFMTSFAIAEEAAAPAAQKEMTVSGTLSVTKEGEKVTAMVVVDAEKKETQVVVNAESEKLAELNGKAVEVTGVCEEKDGKTCMTVKSFKACDKAPEAK